jgi:deoxycytidylate deaminase
MIYIEPPEYSFDLSPTFNSDQVRMRRVWDLFGSYTDENNFDLAAGIYGSKLISGGSNERRSHAQLYPYRQALHAEQVAIMSSRTSVEGSTLYVCRSTENTFLLAKPCFWCMHRLIQEGINRVVYTTGIASTPIESFKISSVEIMPKSSLDIDYQLVS